MRKCFIIINENVNINNKDLDLIKFNECNKDNVIKEFKESIN